MGNSKKKKKTGIKNERNNKFIAIIAISAFILLIFFFIMFSEAVVSGKITIYNETSADIENVRLYFSNANSEYYSYYGSADYVSEDLISKGVEAGGTAKGDFDKIDMFSLDAQLIVTVLIDGEEVEYHAGEFNESFKGKIRVRMYEEDGSDYITIYAETGVFGLFSKVKSNVTYLLR